MLHVEVNQVVENLHVRHLNPCLLLDEVFDLVNASINGDRDALVARGDFHVFSPFNSQLKTSAEAGPITKVSRIASVVMCSSP
jgi:hypothetical protein